MKISVIIPTYKPGDYIWECLDSLKNQSMDKSDYEVIIVLNGCCEPYYSSIKEYLDSQMAEFNVIYIQTDTGGVSNARNIALDHASGEYVTFLDDDDYVSEEYLSLLYECASPETIALCCPYEFDDKTGKQLDSPYSGTYEKLSPKGRQPYGRSKKYFSVPWMKLIHRDMIGSRRFDAGLKNCEDSLFMFLISDKFRYVDYTSPKAIYYRRQREGSAVAAEGGKWTIIKHRLQLCCYYTGIYFRRPAAYKFSFYFTRLLAACNSMLRLFI